LFETHARYQAAVTLAVARVPSEESPRFGMATLGVDDRIAKLEEKPAFSTSVLASMGVALFETDVLASAFAHPVVDLTTDVLNPMVDAGARVYAHTFEGYWEDVGTLRAYYRAS